MFVDLVIYRDVELTEKLDYSSVVALLGFSLILAIFQAFNGCCSSDCICDNAYLVSKLL